MNFMRFKWLYFLLSGLVIIPGLISLVRWGLKPSVDFAGGSLLEYQPEGGVDLGRVKDFLKEKGIDYESVVPVGEKGFLLRMKVIDKNKAGEIKSGLEEKLEMKLVEERFEMVGPSLGKELLIKTIIAIFLASLAIMVYVWLQFKEKLFGISAILAMFHDSLVLLGSFSLFGHFFGVEVDTLFVTAMLTILSFSVHDTVVVYDRIRESRKLFPKASFDDLANKAVTETLSRSLNNSLTIIFMLVSLLLLGGETTKWFVVALLIGTISGTYSSTFTAVPILVVWERIRARRNQ